MVLFYGNRSVSHTMFAEELLMLKNRFLSRFAVHFIMSREPQDMDVFNGRLDGRKLTEFAGRLFDPAAIDEVFVCGPGDMVVQLSGSAGGAGSPIARPFRALCDRGDCKRRSSPGSGCRR